MNYGGGYTNDYSTTSYGAQGGADGGGFMGGESGSQGASKNYGKDTVRPLTIKQILVAHQAHPDAEFKVDNDDINQITFVGQIRSISTQTTNITYKLDDGTGTIEVKQWIDAETNNDQMELDSGKPKLQEEGYCRVWGKLKAFNNKKHVGAHVLRPITDYNEINYHLLEATAVHLMLTRGPPQSAANSKIKSETNGDYKPEIGVNGKPIPQMSPMARKAYNLFADSAQSNEGLHLQMLASQLGVNVHQAAQAAEELAGLSLIYTTVDEETWAALS